MANPQIKLKRSSTQNKRPTPANVPLGELALNTYDGYLYASKNVGVGTTVITVNPWKVGTGTDSYDINFTAGNVGINSASPTALLDVNGDVSIASTVSIGTTIEIIPYDNLGTLSFEGSAGQLFSITNNLTSGSIFSVNDISGLPSIDVDADGTIQLAPNSSTEYVGIGTTVPTAKLDVNGGVNVSGVVTATSFSGSGSNLTGIVTGIQAGNNITILESPTGNFIVTSTASGGTGTATTITLADESTDTTCFPIFATDATGDQEPKTGSNLTFNSSTGALSAGSFVKSGGNSSEFLKADGSVDSSTYLTSYTETQTLDDVLGLGNVSGIGLSVGVITATSFDGNAGTATSLETAKNFSVTGDFVTAPAVSFDGTGAVALAATITADSITLGTYTSGNYVESIVGTEDEIDVTSGTGEGSTPTIGFAANPTIGGNVNIGQDLTVTRDLQVTRNLNVDGTVTIGGTSATIFAETLKISDPDLILGVRTDAGGNDISNDTTANHGGIAIASTEGTPLVTLVNPGAGETLPSTYKKIMWFKTNSFTGLNTDTWLSNYAFGVGTTSMSSGTKFAVGNIEANFDDFTSVRHINSSGVGTFTTLDIGTGGIDVDGHTELDDLNVSGVATATSFVKSGGTSSQFLKADGSVDNSTYLTSYTETQTLDDVLGLGNTSDTGLSVGIVTATSFDGNLTGFDELTAPHSSTTKNYSVTVSSKSDHRYQGSGSGSAYYIDGVESPILHLTPGRTYRFTLSSSDMSSHPFRFYLEADKTTQYTTDVTTTSTYAEITITDSTPAVIHYQCSSHGYMGNAIITHSNAVNTPYLITGLNGANITGVVTATSFVKSDGTSSQFLKADGSVDSSTYLTSYTETDPVVAAINGIVKSNGSTISAASAGTDYLAPDGDGSGLSGIVTNIQAGANITVLESPTGNFIVTSTAAGGGGDTVTINATATDILSVSSGDISADDAGADKLVFWDDSESKLTYLTAGSGLSISGTTITASGGGGSSGVGIESGGTSVGTAITTINFSTNLTATASGGIATITASGGGGGGGNPVSRSSNETTATAGQTVFSGTYTAGFVDVFLNGSKLDSSEFTATNGTSITLTTGATANDIIEIVGYTFADGSTNIELSEDTTPELSGNLDLKGFNIVDSVGGSQIPGIIDALEIMLFT